MAITDVTFFRRRNINAQSGSVLQGFIPDVVIEERHIDELDITEHPVERGANITDHAYKRPPMLEMDMVLRASTGFFGAVSSVLADVSDPIGAIRDASATSNPSDVYAALRAVQDRRVLLTLVTGKRRYTDMLLRQIQVVTNDESENILRVSCKFQNVIIVETRLYDTSGVQAKDTPVYGNKKVRKGTRQLGAAQTIDNSTGYQGVPEDLF